MENDGWIGENSDVTFMCWKHVEICIRACWLVLGRKWCTIPNKEIISSLGNLSVEFGLRISRNDSSMVRSRSLAFCVSWTQSVVVPSQNLISLSPSLLRPLQVCSPLVFWQAVDSWWLLNVNPTFCGCLSGKCLDTLAVLPVYKHVLFPIILSACPILYLTVYFTGGLLSGFHSFTVFAYSNRIIFFLSYLLCCGSSLKCQRF